jgi:hypothetical protein
VKIALITLLGNDVEQLEMYFEFHRRAGVDVVVVGEKTLPAQAGEAIDRFAVEGFVKRVSGKSHTDLARVAVDEMGVDWVIPSTPEELWWPRGESLRDVLAVIPPRYRVVQALLRTFVDGPESLPGRKFESRTVRTSLLGPDGSGGAPPEQLLGPIYRAEPAMTIDDDDWTLGGRRVPLRAWYPVEVFRFPETAPLSKDELDAGLAAGSLVVDLRYRDALAAQDASAFVVPTIVDDASYAVECAAVGEVDLVRLDEQIRELEHRIAELEARFWPTVRRRLRRLARRPS